MVWYHLKDICKVVTIKPNPLDAAIMRPFGWAIRPIKAALFVSCKPGLGTPRTHLWIDNARQTRKILTNSWLSEALKLALAVLCVEPIAAAWSVGKSDRWLVSHTLSIYWLNNQIAWTILVNNATYWPASSEIVKMPCLERPLSKDALGQAVG